MDVSVLVHWINERQAVSKKKKASRPKPWTDDPIIRDYRFCNVHREDDKVTQWITSHWRVPNAHDLDFWFAAAVARYVNWPDTLAILEYPIPWSKSHFLKTLQDIEARGGKVWTGAYIVSTNGVKMSKPEYVANLLDNLWQQRDKIRPTKDDTLESFYRRLVACNGVGQFMAGQIIADSKYVGLLAVTKDWGTFAISGPGSRRGMNRLLGRDKNAPISERVWKSNLDKLADIIATEISFEMHNQDLQNCLCEYDKYERVRLKEGRPRAKYPGIK